VHRLAGGASSLTFAATDDHGEPVVVKVAPPGMMPDHHRDVLRQARVMEALRGSPVSVPAVRWQDPGDPPDVPPLFVMGFVEGSSLEPLFDLDAAEDGGEDGETVARRLTAAARTLAALHAIDPASVGLRDEPVRTMVDEVDRWSRLLATVDAALAPGWADVADALRATAVEPMAPAIVHGDFRLGNLLATGSAITAVIDWEIWSVGDPRVDLGWFLVNADPETYRRPTRYAGALPPPDELARTYASALGRPVPDQATFAALACFKSTATWSLIVKHNRRRTAPDPDLEALAPTLPHLLDRARQLLA